MPDRSFCRPAAATAAALAAAVLTAMLGCASPDASPDAAPDLGRATRSVMKASFRSQGIARLERLDQDFVQQACSSDQPPGDDLARRIMAESVATLRPPAGGRYLGDWRQGERLAQSGRGMTWTDASDKPAANGASCYNCHQIGPAELSFGTVGPSLYHYGKLRGVTDPADPASAAVVQYTWGKLWNSKAYVACSNMPRFGHLGLLDEDQLRHLMALLLDPRSPVNQ